MTTPLPALRRPFLAAGAGAFVLIGTLLAGRDSAQEMLSSYLVAFVFFTGLSIGSLALILVHALTGGRWGHFIRPQLMAAARTLPVQAILALPLLAGLQRLYPWADLATLSHDAALRAQTWYLEPGFFAARTIAYFAVWLVVLHAVRRRLDRHACLAPAAAVGMIVYALTASLAAVDWIMSLMPHWHSSAFGLSVAIGWMLSAMALATLLRVCAPDAADDPDATRCLPDLGNLLLALVLGWAYLGLMQYLTVWTADLPSETIWYIPRVKSTWRYLAGILVVGHFVLPFAALLSRPVKRNPRWLAVVAAALVAENFADSLWLVAPDVRSHGLLLVWSDLSAPLGMGMLWLGAFASFYSRGSPSRRAAGPGAAQMESMHG